MVCNIIEAILWWIHPQKITLIDVETYTVTPKKKVQKVQKINICSYWLSYLFVALSISRWFQLNLFFYIFTPKILGEDEPTPSAPRSSDYEAAVPKAGR